MKEKSMAPDTLLLEERARLSLNYLTRNLDRKFGYLPYFWTILEDRPIEARHDFPDFGDITGRFVDALILIRNMLGTKDGEYEENKLKKLLLSYFSEGDGLSYRPKTPWSSHDAMMFDQSSVLFALVSWYLETKEKGVRETIVRMINGLWKIGVKREGYLEYFYEVYGPTGWDWNYNGGEGASNRPVDSCYDGGRIIMPAMRFFEETGDERALALAENITNWNLYHSTSTKGQVFFPDGHFALGPIHPILATIAGILKYAIVTGKGDMIEWAESAYRYAKSLGGSMGYFYGGENCTLVDAVDIAILLAEHRDERCWEDVEVYARNHLAEAQVTDVSRFCSNKKKRNTQQSSFQDIPQRIKGCFSSQSTPNNLFNEKGLLDPVLGFVKQRIAHCCGPSGARAIYRVWSKIVTKNEEGVFINLALSRDSEWVRVDSSHPYQGRMVLTAHKPSEVFVRIPLWAERSEVKVKKDTVEETGHGYRGNYLKIGRIRPGQSVEVEYPLPERSYSEHIIPVPHQSIGLSTYKVSWKGSTVVNVSPAGKTFPLYQREHFLKDRVPVKNYRYCNPKDVIKW